MGNARHKVAPGFDLGAYVPADGGGVCASTLVVGLVKRLQGMSSDFVPVSDVMEKLLCGLFDLMTNWSGYKVEITDQNSGRRAVSPFREGEVKVLFGRKGVGKTCLLEAFINELKKSAPAVLKEVFFLKGSITGYAAPLKTAPSEKWFDGRHILVIDNPFPRCSSFGDLEKKDIVALIDLLSIVRDKKMMCIIGSDFRFSRELAANIGRKGGNDSASLMCLLDKAEEVEVLGRNNKGSLRSAANAGSFVGERRLLVH